jgi:hypothetical protein
VDVLDAGMPDDDDDDDNNDDDDAACFLPGDFADKVVIVVVVFVVMNEFVLFEDVIAMLAMGGTILLMSDLRMLRLLLACL